ncbi:MAG: transcriptional repressor LexA [Ignavibacteriales bacterium]|nr:MAG: transcriptional repressor LexA [Ignavibacteriales bacterium]
MKQILTDRQEEIYCFINSYRELNGFPPTIREIAKHFNISSTFGVKKHLDALVKKGYLHIESNASRGISTIQDENFVDKNEAFNKIPVVGRVAAGSPILAEQNIEGSLVIDPSFIKRKENCFALKVKGDSMIKAGIFEGDFVIVVPVTEAKNGDIIVALIDDEATVKTFESRNGSVRLLPENDRYQPIEIKDNANFSIAGKVKGIIRYFN